MDPLPTQYILRRDPFSPIPAKREGQFLSTQIYLGTGASRHEYHKESIKTPYCSYATAKPCVLFHRRILIKEFYWVDEEGVNRITTREDIESAIRGLALYTLTISKSLNKLPPRYHKALSQHRPQRAKQLLGIYQQLRKLYSKIFVMRNEMDYHIRQIEGHEYQGRPILSPYIKDSDPIFPMLKHPKYEKLITTYLFKMTRYVLDDVLGNGDDNYMEVIQGYFNKLIFIPKEKPIIPPSPMSTPTTTEDIPISKIASTVKDPSTPVITTEIPLPLIGDLQISDTPTIPIDSTEDPLSMNTPVITETTFGGILDSSGGSASSSDRLLKTPQTPSVASVSTGSDRTPTAQSDTTTIGRASTVKPYLVPDDSARSQPSPRKRRTGNYHQAFKTMGRTMSKLSLRGMMA